MSQPSLTKGDNQQREVCVSAQQRHETHVSKSKHESCACSAQCELHVFEPYVFDSRRKGDSQKLKSPRQPEANVFDPPPTDLRDYLTKKRSANQITLFCCCERLITTMFSECCCSSYASKQSVFRRLTSTSRSAKRCRSHRRRAFSDVEYLKSLQT